MRSVVCRNCDGKMPKSSRNWLGNFNGLATEMHQRSGWAVFERRPLFRSVIKARPAGEMQSQRPVQAVPRICATPEHDELKAIAKDCITRHHAHHYLGFAATQRKLFRKKEPPKVKPLLYVYRVLLTGIHLVRTGEVEGQRRDVHL